MFSIAKSTSRLVPKLYITTLIPKASYARGLRAPRQTLPPGLKDLDGGPLLGSESQGGVSAEQVLQDAEEVEDMFNTPSGDRLQEIIGEEERRRQKVINKIIKKKYFKDPQELNLLTWDAKEQIRYLHAEYPNEWTLEKLAESFPTCREGIINILKSQYFPRSVDEIIKHDKRVKKHWKQLASGKSEGGPIAMRYEQLKLEGKMWTLTNAAGNTMLPKQELYKSLPEGDKNSRSRKPGPFESIVKDYVEKKQAAINSSTTDHPRLLLSAHTEENVKMLKSVVDTTSARDMNRSYKDESVQTKIGNIPRKKMDKVSYAFIDSNLDPGKKDKPTDSLVQSDMSNISLFDAINQSPAYPDENVDTDGRDVDSEKRSSLRRQSVGGLRKRSRKTHEPVPLGHDMETLQMLDTQKIENKPHSGNEKNYGNSDYEERQGRIKQYAEVDRETQSMYDSIRYDTKDESVDQQEEAYLYDENKGYQYPYGKHTGAYDNIKVKSLRNKTKKSVVYQKGKEHYSEDGEFLYRVP